MNAPLDGYTQISAFGLPMRSSGARRRGRSSCVTQAQSDPHAPDEYRTNSILQDLPEFAKSFQCKKTDKMVSEKPCRVW